MHVHMANIHVINHAHVPMVCSDAPIFQVAKVAKLSVSTSTTDLAALGRCGSRHGSQTDLVAMGQCEQYRQTAYT